MKRLILTFLLCVATITTYAVLPEVTLYDTKGHPVRVSSLAKTGKPVIISFFATWCKPCLRELKAIHELYPDWQDETGVEMYIVSIDQAQDSHKVQPLVNSNGWDYHVLLDPNGALKRAMNVQSVPHIFVLNSRGEIVYTHVGYAQGDEDNLRKYLK